MSVEISEWMSIVIPSSKTRIQTSPKDRVVIDNNSLIMMRPEKFVLNSKRIFKEIMGRVSHDSNHVLVDFFECGDCMFRVHCSNESDIVVDYPIDFNASGSSPTKTELADRLWWEIHPVKSPIVVFTGRSSKEEFRSYPPTDNCDSVGGLFQRFGQGVEIILAIDEPFEFIPRSRCK